MNKIQRSCLSCLLLLVITACAGQEKSHSAKGQEASSKPVSNAKAGSSNKLATSLFPEQTTQAVRPDSATQIGEYVREVFEDQQGNLWFGTLARGVARYDGTNLTYFTTKDGLAGNQINGIAEDQEGKLWFATTSGVSRYDGTSFTNFREEEGLADNDTWSILADRAGNIWVSTVEGVSRYNGIAFTDFELPKTTIKDPTYQISPKLVWCMIEDQQGAIWLGTDGLGVFKYDGESFTHFTKQDGLCTNNVISMLADQQGNIWFGSAQTRIPEKDHRYSYVDSADGGLSRYDGQRFSQFTSIEGLHGSDIGPIYEDKTGKVWIASMHYGVYRYDGEQFTNFQENQGLTYNCIQSILEDRHGKLWFGFSGGLFRFNGVSFDHITKDGPW